MTILGGDFWLSFYFLPSTKSFIFTNVHQFTDIVHLRSILLQCSCRFRRWSTFPSGRGSRSRRANGCGRGWRKPRVLCNSPAVRRASWHSSWLTVSRRTETLTSLARWTSTHRTGRRAVRPSRSRRLERCLCYTRSDPSLNMHACFGNQSLNELNCEKWQKG